MVRPFTFTLSFSLLIFRTLTSLTAHPTFNISHFLYPKTSDELRPEPSPFLEDVLRAVSLRQGWNNTEDVRVSKLDSRNAGFGSSPRYEFQLRIGKKQLILKLRDEVSLWKKMMTKKKGVDFESVVKEVSSMAVLDAFRIKGPFELQARGDDEFLLQLPLNISHAGLTRVLVGEGITLEVKNAQEVSLFHAMELGVNRNIVKEGRKYWPLQHTSCESLLPIHVSGSATVAAYRDRNPNSYIETRFPSRDTIELLPEKCYIGHIYEKRHHPMESLNLKIAVMEKLLRSFLGSKINQNGVFGSLRANIRASAVVRFKMELERNIRTGTLPRMLAEWRTRPTVERVWFEATARIEGDRLKPVILRKIRPFVEVDSSAWRIIMSNISFTKFPSSLVPPEALTLDVKW